MASGLYSVPDTVVKQLDKFRFASSRSNDLQAQIYELSKENNQLQKSDEEIYSSLDELADALPENSPRFIVLSYPLTLKDGRKTSPYVLLYYLPPNSSQNNRMLYAGAVELVRTKSGVQRVFEIEEESDLYELENLLIK